MAEARTLPAGVRGHGDRLAGLWRAAAAGRLPHALLFHGAAGIGKHLSALALARGLLCAEGPRESGPCERCGACRRFASGGHPDLLSIDPPREIDELIRVGYVVRRDGASEIETSADEFLALRPMEGGWRVVVVRDAERVVEQAQNALLKMLEEPGASVLWILTTARPASLLATIRSRMVPVRFDALSEVDCAALLAEHGLAPADARRLARFSHGSPGEALSLARRNVDQLRAVIVDVLCARVDAWSAAAALNAVEGRFEGKTPTGRERERARTVIELAALVLTDLARLSAGVAADRLAHGDLATARDAMALARQPRLLAKAHEELVRLRADVDLNLDPSTCLERAVLLLAARDASELVC